MKSHRSVLIASVLLLVPTTWAGLYEDLYRGLELLTTPIGGASGNRFGGLRVVPNRLGQGYRLELNRSFGTDANGRPEVFDLGALELELDGDISTTAGYTTRFFNIGNLQTTANNMSYSLRGKTGAQDFTLTGTFNMIQNVEVNEFGFYTYNLNVANDSAALFLDAIAVDGIEPSEFDIGPISVKGNIFVDVFGAVLGSMGVDTSGISDLFPESPIDRIAAAIQDELTAQSGERVGEVAGQLELGQIGLGLGSPSLSTENLQNSLNQPNVVPEPASLALVIAGAGLILRRRSGAVR